MKTRIISVILAAVTAMTALIVIPVSATIELNSTVFEEELGTRATVWLGEIVDPTGEDVKYIYSSDFSLKSGENSPVAKLSAMLGELADKDFKALFDTLDPEATGTGLALCSDAELTASVNDKWTSASFAASVIYPGVATENSASGNICDADDGALAFVQTDAEARQAVVTENALGVDKSFIAYTDISDSSCITYTVIDQQLVKTTENFIKYTCEEITVMYTSISLALLPGDLNGDGTLNAKDVVALLRLLTGWEDEGIIVAAADYNKDKKVNAKDAIGLMKEIISRV